MTINDPFVEQALSMLARNTPFQVTVGGELRPKARATAHRTPDLGIAIELISAEWRPELRQTHKIGDVRLLDAEMLFSWSGVMKGVAVGVFCQRQQRRQTGPASAETAETYVADSLTWTYDDGREPEWCIEWVTNLPQMLIWPERNEVKTTGTYTQTLGSDDRKIVLRHTDRAHGGDGAIHANVGGMDVYIVRSEDAGREVIPGRIVYGGCPDRETRQRVRDCLSFILGRPMVLLGHTLYDSKWIPTETCSVAAATAQGVALQLGDWPPYPITQGDTRILDGKRFSDAVETLYARYNDLGLRELCWAYWYAACAPTHSAAVHYGGLIEQLQRRVRALQDPEDAKLLADAAAVELQDVVERWLATQSVDDDTREVLLGKVRGLNQAPQNLSLKRLLERLGLQIANPELKAWRHRNRAAHGAHPDDHIDAILNVKLLAVLFHRMVAAVSGCSKQYWDYYSLGHPSRPLQLPVPPRS